MKFNLEIELGNDAMQTAYEVTAAIVRSMERNTDADEILGLTASGSIQDVNGNIVGEWSVSDVEE